MDQPFKVRDKSQARFKKAILALPLRRNDSCNYNYADAQIFNKQVDRELKRQHNEFTTNVTKGLTSNNPNNVFSHYDPIAPSHGRLSPRHQMQQP